MLNQKEVIEKLKKEAAHNPVAKDVFYMWAMRQRARNQVTVQALSQRMAEQGFKHTDDQYREVLKFLHSIGLGRLSTTSKGKITALIEVTLTLQSVGQAAAGSGSLDKFKSRPVYAKLKQVERREDKRRSSDAIEKAWAAPETKSVVGIAYMVGPNKTIYIPVPKELKPNEVADLISRLTHEVLS